MMAKNFPRGVFGDNRRYHQKLYLIDTFKEAGAKTLSSFCCKNISIFMVHNEAWLLKFNTWA